MKKWLAMTGLVAMAAWARAADEGVALTVYNQNFGIVRETRAVEVPEREGWIRFTDVAALIDGTSVQFKSRTDPQARVLEQNFEYDLVSADKLLQKYIDRALQVLTKDGSQYSGTLLSFDANQLVLRQKQDVVMVQRGDNVKDIQFGALPEGLITKPTLVWKLATTKPGRHLVELAYETGGLNWSADYHAVLNERETALDFGGWVTLVNQSGATYRDATLKLVAGDVRRIQPPAVHRYAARAMAMDAAAPQFEQKAFFEYHLYTLQRPTTVAQNQTKQVELLSATEVPMRKIFFYEGGPQVRFHGGVNTDPNFGSDDFNKKVTVVVEIQNSQANRLGMPLPKGRVRLYKRDTADGALEFIGEDEIDHTPKDETIKLTVGHAFDVVGERKRTDFQVDSRRKLMTETFEIRLRNHKTEPISVLVKETLYRGANWEITQASAKWTKYDAHTIHFTVPVRADGEQVVTYTVQYTW